MLNVVILSVVMLIVLMLNVVKLSVIMLIVLMLNVVAPFENPCPSKKLERFNLASTFSLAQHIFTKTPSYTYVVIPWVCFTQYIVG